MQLVDSQNPVLRKKAKLVEKFDNELLIYIDDLFKRLETLEGVGLAAPQVGRPIAVAVLEYSRSEKDEKDIQSIPKMVLINPKITWKGNEKELKLEACFSLPKKEFEVPRFKKIHVEYLDEHGKRKKIKAKGFFSRVLQHEIDHLNGILICDYV